MRPLRTFIHKLLFMGLVASVACSGTGYVYAAPSEHRDHDYRGTPHSGRTGPEGHHYVIRRGHSVVVPPDRIQHYHGVVVLRPYGHWYRGYGPYRSDAEALHWLAFTAITLAILNELSEAQQRALEAAQIRATTAPIGESIIWKDGSASGTVTPIREGTSTSGRYCREFQQKVTIGGKTEEAYGTACQNPDGTWEVVSTGSSQ